MYVRKRVKRLNKSFSASIMKAAEEEKKKQRK